MTLAIREFATDGARVIDRWFSSRKSDRAKPPMQNQRESELNGFKPNTRLPEYTVDLIDLLNVVGILVDLEPSPADALERVLAGELIDGLVPDPYADQVPTSAKSVEGNSVLLGSARWHLRAFTTSMMRTSDDTLSETKILATRQK